MMNARLPLTVATCGIPWAGSACQTIPCQIGLPFRDALEEGMTDTDLATGDPLSAALARDDAVWAREHLERDVVAWLTTVAPDGRVQSSVISFLYDGGALYFYSQPGTPKVRNLAHSPLVSFHLQSDPYGDHWLIVEGTAVIDATIPPLDENDLYVAKYTEPHAHWGLDFTQSARDFSAPIRIRPTRVRLG
jgi:PPOX class probable F420-dependent enzyme